MIKITLKEYKNIYKLLSAGAEDMEIGISNILNSDLSDASLQILVKALPGRRRHAFIQSFLEQKSIEDEDKHDSSDVKTHSHKDSKIIRLPDGSHPLEQFSKHEPQLLNAGTTPLDTYSSSSAI